MKEAIRYAFLTDWVHQASTEEIVEKLIQNDERGKKINKAIEYLEKSKLNQLDTHCKYLHIDFDSEKIENIDELLDILKGDSDDE